MLKSIFYVIARILLILLVAAAIVGLASYGLSQTANLNPRFGNRAGGTNFDAARPPANNGQPPAQNFRPRGGEEGFRGNGSLTRGLFQVFTNTLLIGMFTWLGLFIFNRNKRRASATN
jgi:hypothetical protein